MINHLRRAYLNWSLNRVSVQLAALREYLEEIEIDYNHSGISCDLIVAEILETRDEVDALEEERNRLAARLVKLAV